MSWFQVLLAGKSGQPPTVGALFMSARLACSPGILVTITFMIIVRLSTRPVSWKATEEGVGCGCMMFTSRLAASVFVPQVHYVLQWHHLARFSSILYLLRVSVRLYAR